MSRSETRLKSAIDQIVRVGRYLDSKGWTPATSSNFSQRLDENHCAITVSGKHKGQLAPDDVMVVDLDGNPAGKQKPSAETLLHTSLYDWDPSVGAILHAHSPNATILSLLVAGSLWQLTGYELQKALRGISSHKSQIQIPIFDNSQDIPPLARQVRNYLEQKIPCWGYLIRGHGIYAWGEDMDEALRHLEAIEYLMQCELELIKIRGYHEPINRISG